LGEHPTLAELQKFLRGDLSMLEARTVVRHLLHGCKSCGETLLSLRVIKAKRLRSLRPRLDSAYDAGIEKALAAARDYRQHATRTSSKIQEALAVFKEKGLSGYLEDPQRFDKFISYEALLEGTQELRHEDPQKMVVLATLAAHIAGQFDPEEHGEQRVADLRCRALVELSNAHRVSDQLEEAHQTLGEAAEYYIQGTEDELLGARLFDVMASLHADSREFDIACEALDTVHAVYCKYGDFHLAGRALISKGLYTGYRGQAQEAIKMMQDGLALIDRDRDSALVFAAAHNLAYLLSECGKFREARQLIWQNRRYYEESAGKVNLLNLRALEGRINVGLDELERAEQAFSEVKQGFESANLPYKAALASLELAMVWIHQGRTAEARTLVLDTAQVFIDLKIHREALAAVLLLRSMFETRVATGLLLKKFIKFMKRAEFDSNSSFNPLAP
jgi:tetratricopeptide (TPR) repeat protein